MRQKGFDADVPAGFLVYPVSQAADIAAFKADLVPVGSDQLPMIEQAAELVRRFNRTYGRTDAGGAGPVLVEPEALLGPVSRLPGTDGEAKMSKTLGNVDQSLRSRRRGGPQGARHVHRPAPSPGGGPGHGGGESGLRVSGRLRSRSRGGGRSQARYRAGGLGDATVKARLAEVLDARLAPIRRRRAEWAREPGEVHRLLAEGTARGRAVAAATLAEVRSAMRLYGS